MIIYFLINGMLFAQDYQLENQFGSFSEATSFALSPQGYFYVTDNGSDEIYKLDSLGIQILAFGGYGWGDGQFDFPIDVSLNALNIFVTDKNNHSVQQFDKDLNFISRLYTREGKNNDAAFGFPLSADISSMGDLFVLDSENKRILKFDLFGNFVQQFGGFDAGEFSIKNPKKLIVAENNNIMVLDGNSLLIFDLFGNGINKTSLSEDFSSIDKYYNTITLTGDSSVYVSSFELDKLLFKKLRLPNITENAAFSASLAVEDKVYVLTKNSIYCFVLSEK
ncbi:MAG: NHL repeat-containing protein [Ignavibacteriaceae bacterium]|nr:NHL repeat-containing protein [Ignavibacteriaceae bacterium]